MLAMPVSGADLGSFRAASDLISSDIVQLERTIADLEEAIRHKDLLIATQESVIEAMEAQAQESSTKVPFGYGASMDKDRFELLAQISDLKLKNQKLEAIFEKQQEGFESLFDAQKEGLAAGLQTLSELPSTPEIKGLYARINKQAGAIITARTAGKVSPISSLRQMADLQHELSRYLVARPLMTYSRSERYRAGVLLAALERDAKRITTQEAARILGENEGVKIGPKQALRAMRFAAQHKPDLAKFQPRGQGKKAYLCRNDSDRGNAR
jgi:NADH dehydrogenase/NADH:ubiquinone oxidoreductase subunit G